MKQTLYNHIFHWYNAEQEKEMAIYFDDWLK